ncbi:type II CRISPR RNA-guided endonuclease Cas9 [Sphingobium sp. CR2-8]|uniref:type II CRISPR RNA-guided endonuclease Cas9 n=1 Tax=Sphingobium sp. CR2-8 TaxID=1306534 RepID=UPI002DB94297|nr:type II CRISPR RNA-guided endonuclease Cas9 [Sphingobium sp. CR2-8]MEC3908934.1 type II CRISPR RNA-guided endonuclease Cas9 [Sphingobium sp. CR2-8]
MMKIQTRLGLDLGTNSLGWCLYTLDAHGNANGIKGIGVRIFSDGRHPISKDSLAVERRNARAMRRRRDRYLQRRSALLAALIVHGLMPQDAAQARALVGLDPYDLRVRALTDKLHPHEIGRALFHLNQRRGFKSNRKADRRTSDKDAGVVKQAEIELDRAMAEAGADTLGQFLHGLATKRVRMAADGSGYDFYPQRRHYEYEFDSIWAAQAVHHPALLNETARAHIRSIIFRQRPLAAQKVGQCTFLEEERLPKAHPLFQERRLYEEVNQLRIRESGEERPLSRDQCDTVILALKSKKKISFETLRKRVLKLSDDARFNKESEARKELLGDEIHVAMSHASRFGGRWGDFPEDARWQIIRQVMEEESHDALLGWLQSQWFVDEATAQAIAAVHLPEGHGRLGETASRLILTELKRDVIDYDEAVRRHADLLGHHSDRRPEEGRDTLPYYGEILDRDLKPGSNDPADPPEIRFGRISNPTVHIGLNQVKAVINDIIAVHGRPDQIVVEIARELKQNDKQREAANKRIAANTRAAEERSKILRDHGIEDNGANRMRLRLWQELSPASVMDRYCPYCGTLGKTIGIRQLFHSSEVDIDHILPYSRTLDDGPANKVVVHTACNRQKGNQTPHEKWGHDPDRWDAILDQVSRLHSAKQWRFLPNAMDRFDKEGGFAERQLKDTQYLSVLAGKYLGSLYGRDEGRRVYVIPGQMTSMLRRIWGLNSILGDHNQVVNKHSDAPKNRLDHRHHALDAAVTGVTTHALIQRIAAAAGRAEQDNLDRLFTDLEHPWPGFRDALKAALDRTVVSHRPDHGLKPKAALHQSAPPHMTAGALHNDTAYGFTGQVNANGVPMVVHRVAIGSIKPEHLIDGGTGRSPAWIVDDALRKALAVATHGKADKTAFAHAIRAFAKTHPQFQGIRGARIIEGLNLIPVRDRTGKVYKGYKGDSNYRYDIWEMPDGKWVTSWKDAQGQTQSGTLSMFDMHQTGEERRPHPAARKVLSLHRNDVLAFDRGSGRELMRVVKFSPAQLALAPLHEAHVDARSRDKESGFRYTLPAPSRLKEWQARQVIVDALGRVRDPGFPARTARRKTGAQP